MATWKELQEIEKVRRTIRMRKTSFSDKKCEVCPNPVGIVSQGQEKRFCSKECRARRHRHSR